ncbi:hypothetical protein B0A48_09070 [Cryoendolithus antarcticus]|uniref:GRIP domain-containing protein n=1 Tax=Cryoendolithus antarcticus TaxID=1507870 RepID=A0A1V8T2A7_9PEZI|nr:hypothetical protein B0A48_09070 [Cryoendolithus antarcticus]
MSSAVTNDASKSASKKKKKSKKKPNGKAQSGTELAEINGSKDVAGEGDDDDEADETPETPVVRSTAEEYTNGGAEGLRPATQASLRQRLKGEDTLHMPSSPPEPLSPDETRVEEPVTNGSHAVPVRQANIKDGDLGSVDAEDSESVQRDAEEAHHTRTETSARLDALQEERETLRVEVTHLRESLEQLQEKHSEELSGVRGELEQSESNREQAETQYRNLLGKVNTIRSQLGERLKADAAELEQARGRIEELEGTHGGMVEENSRLQDTVASLNEQLSSQTTELKELRQRTSLSTSNWVKERDDFVSREAYLREEFEVAKQAMQDWEILFLEERAKREISDERAQELQDQISNHQESYERLRSEAETQSSTVDGLQRALREVQEERKRELRELVEQSQSQLEALRIQVKGAEESTASLKSQLDTTKTELDRALPFEKEVKEKNLLIGKLRHEAVILNDHLTKALRFLKRGKPEDNVDRQLVTNHFLHFLALDRSDPKKFQILQLIAALLGWTEQQKEQAGLLRAGAGLGTLRLPVSPFRRTPSTPTLGEFVPESPGGASRESLAELWSDFLEREAEAGSVSGSRRGSVAQSVKSAVVSPIEGPGRQGGRSPEMRRKESGVGGG